MWNPGKRVVIRDKDGNDGDVGVVQEVTEGDDQMVKVKTADGAVREVASNNLVEQLED